MKETYLRSQTNASLCPKLYIYSTKISYGVHDKKCIFSAMLKRTLVNIDRCQLASNVQILKPKLIFLVEVHNYRQRSFGVSTTT